MIAQQRLAPFLAAVFLLGACSGTDTRLKKGKTLEGEVVEAEGTAPYDGDNLPATRAAALAAAQRAAVELVVGVYVNAKTRVEKAVTIEQQILARTSGYIKRYEVLSEGRSGEWYKMRIRALVSTQEIHSELDSAGMLRQPSIGHPRVALFIKEFVGEKESTDGAASRALTQVLLGQGFKVVDLPKSIDRDDDPLEAAKAISRNAAELLLAGLARAQSLGDEKKLGGMASYRASVTFRVIEVGTGEVVQTVSQTAGGLEGTRELAAQKALEKAAEMTAADLKLLPQELTKRAHIELTITGLTSFEVLAQFQKGLSSVPGVKEHYLRSYRQEAGIAVIDVLADQISPQELADRGVKIGGTTWSVYQVTGRSVQLSASQAGR